MRYPTYLTVDQSLKQFKTNIIFESKIYQNRKNQYQKCISQLISFAIYHGLVHRQFGLVINIQDGLIT